MKILILQEESYDPYLYFINTIYVLQFLNIFIQDVTVLIFIMLSFKNNEKLVD